MSRLLRARVAHSGVVRRCHICLGGDLLWLRLACAAGLVIGIAQQLVLRAQHPHGHAGDVLGSVDRRHHAVRWSCLLVSGELPRLPFWSSLGCSWYSVGCGGFASQSDSDVVQLQVRNLPGAPEEPFDPPRWYGWAGVVICGFLVLGFVAATLSLPAAVFALLGLLAVAMLA